MSSSSEIVEAHLPCPDCGSSDAMTLYDDGHTYCFSCEQTHRQAQGEIEHTNSRKNPDCLSPSDMEFKPLPKRGIKLDTCKKYKYYVAHHHGKGVQVACYFDSSDKLVFQKLRDKDKNMSILGKSEYTFFGQQLFKGGGKKLIVTEGEIDCLTVSQVQGNKYPVVSIPMGAGSAGKTFKSNLAWLESFEEVIVFFDNDKAGQEGLEKVKGLLSPHKLKIATLPLKDPNEMLLAGRADELVNAIWRAEEYRPDGIVHAKDCKERLFSEEGSTLAYDFPWNEDLNKKTLGVRKKEITLVTAGTGIGKSTAVKEIAYKLAMKDNLRVGLMMLEDPIVKVMKDILSIHLQKPLHLTWNTEKTKTEAEEHFDEVFGSDRFILYDHFGSLESDNLLAKMRYMVVGDDCDFIILDHITIAISGLDTDKGDVKALDMLMTNLRVLADELDVGIIVISHLRKVGNNDTPFEEGGAVSLEHLRGSGSLKQIADTIISLERNQQADDEESKNQIRIRVLKCRFTGDTGLTKDVLQWNKKKNRLEKCTIANPNPKEEKEEVNCQF